MLILRYILLLFFINTSHQRRWPHVWPRPQTNALWEHGGGTMAAWRNQRLRWAAGRRRGVYDIECSLCFVGVLGLDLRRNAPPRRQRRPWMYDGVRLASDGGGRVAAVCSSEALCQWSKARHCLHSRVLVSQHTAAMLWLYSTTLLFCCVRPRISSGIHYVIRSALVYTVNVVYKWIWYD